MYFLLFSLYLNSQSAVRSPQSAVRSPQSAVRSPQYMFYTDRVNWHQPRFFRQYVRRHWRRSFSNKTRTTILFTNTTWNRLGFGVTRLQHINETEDIVYQSNIVGVELISHVDTLVGLR